jgi:ABC-type sugar transport system substrate-binding protein
MKKRKIALVLAVVMVLLTLLAGCGSNNSGDSQAATPPADGGSGAAAPADEPTAAGGPNANADGSTNFENVAYFDPDYDYSQDGPFKVKYLCGFTGPLYESQSEGIAFWCEKEGIQYDGMWATNGDNDMFLNQLQTCIDQGYDGIIIDPDTTIYPAILEKLNAHPEVPWIATMSPARDTSSNEDPQPLQHPFVGHEHYMVGREMMEKCIEYKDENWADVDWSEVGVIEIDYSIVAALHDRQRGSLDVWTEEMPEYPDSFFTVDASSGGMDADTARNLVQPLISTNSQYTHWLIVACMDDYAIGASAAVDDMNKALVVTMGGTGLVKIFDAGQEDAWRYAVYTPGSIYIEPVVGALNAFMSGYATPDTIWPQWVNENDHGTDGHTYAGYLLPYYWIDKDNYQKMLAWSDVYAGSDIFPNYPRDGITRDTFTAIGERPDYYNG